MYTTCTTMHCISHCFYEGSPITTCNDCMHVEESLASTVPYFMQYTLYVYKQDFGIMDITIIIENKGKNCMVHYVP